jgi:hypothetical protein
MTSTQRVAPGFDHVETWMFDLDATPYRITSISAAGG